MKSSKRYLNLTMAIFSLVAVVQLLRLVMGWSVNIAGAEIPMWASAVALVVASTMALWAFQLLDKRRE